MAVRAAAVVVAALALAGCTSTAGTGSAHDAPPQSQTSAASTARPTTGSALPVGAGPQSHYTVQTQPAAGTCHYQYESGQPLPDQACTPGAISPAVTQANIATTICATGYTATIRPSSYVTGKEKTANAASYGYTGALHEAEYDHQISLELGGDPNDRRNLWLEPPSPGHRPGAGPNNPKDTVENKLHAAVCSGKATLAQAQMAIATDWTTALSSLNVR